MLLGFNDGLDGSDGLVQIIVDNLVWIAGCVIYALAINFFNVPNQIAQGGFSGLAIVINYLTDLPVGTGKNPGRTAAL